MRRLEDSMTKNKERVESSNRWMDSEEWAWHS